MSNCCKIKENDKKVKHESGTCPSCQEAGKKVQTITLTQLIKRKYQQQIQKDLQYFFCASQCCDVVYYSLQNDFVLKKEAVRVRVGQKESQDPIHLCYCFDYTREDIVTELRDTGKCTIAEDITQKIKDGLCACEIRNPESSCCLGNVNAAIRSLKDNHDDK